MLELELTRAPGDRRLYLLDGVGTLRLRGPFSRAAVAEAGGRRFGFSGRGLWRGTLVAEDEAGGTVAEFAPRALRGGGALVWGGRELTLRPASAWRQRYALAEGEHELALLEGKGFGKRPVRVAVDPAALADPGLLLFAAWVVHRASEDASTAAAAASSGGVASS
jgi:hypothetical protein